MTNPQPTPDLTLHVQGSSCVRTVELHHFPTDLQEWILQLTGGQDPFEARVGDLVFHPPDLDGDDVDGWVMFFDRYQYRLQHLRGEFILTFDPTEP